MKIMIEICLVDTHTPLATNSLHQNDVGKQHGVGDLFDETKLEQSYLLLC